MYNVILNVYSESLCKKQIKKKEKIYSYGPFENFDQAQSYMDNEMSKQVYKIRLWIGYNKLNI